MRKVNYKYFVLLILLFALSVLIHVNSDIVLEHFKPILSSKYWMYISFLAFPISILYKIKFNDFDSKEFLAPKKFTETLSELLALIIEPSTFICSLSVLRGLLFDYFYGDEYFGKFNNGEKSFLLIASVYFFIVTLIELKKNAVEIVTDIVTDTSQIEETEEL